MLRIDQKALIQLWRVLAVVFLAGCDPVGVAEQSPLTPAESFERALMAYAGGNLDQAALDLGQVIAADSSDQRAIELLQAVRREKGNTPRDEVSDSDSNSDSFPVEPLSPDQLLQAVLAHNPEIRKAVLHVVEARAQLREANVRLSPAFRLLTRFRPLGVFASLQQSIFGGLWRRRALMHQGEQGVIAALARYARVRREVLDRALSAYLDLLEAEDLIVPWGEELKAREEQVRIARLLLQYGSLSFEDLIHMEKEIPPLRQELARVRGQVVVAKATLNGLMGKPVEEPLSVLRRRVAMEMPEDLHQVITAAQEWRPELKQARAEFQQARAGRDVIATELPRVDLRGTYGSSTKAGRGDFLEGPSIGTVFSAPILFWPLRRTRLDREKAFVRQLEIEIQRLLGEIAVEAAEAYEELLMARGELGSVEKEVDAARESLRISRAVERWGGGDPLSLIAAEIQYARALRGSVAQDYSLQRAAFTLQRTVGTPPEQNVFALAPGTSPLEHRNPSTPSTYLGRALWVWRPAFLEKTQETEFFLDFCEARGIKTLFLFAAAEQLLDDPESFHRFLPQAHARGLTVHAMNGKPSWVFPDRSSEVAGFIEAVFRYNGWNPPEARFDAIHLNLGPQAMPKINQQGFASRFVEFLQWISDRVRQGGLPLAFDVPPWFDKIALGSSSLLEDVLDRVDQVVLIKNPDQREGAVEASRAGVERAVAKGRKVWIGLSADPADLRRLSPGEPHEAQVEQMALQVEEAFQGKRSVLGIAIHDYNRYRRLILKNPFADQQAIPGEEDPPASFMSKSAFTE